MQLLETKNFKKYFIILTGIFFLISPFFSAADDYSSGSFTVKDPVIDQGSDSTVSASFGLGQSIGQLAIGQSTSASFQVWSGFQYFFQVNANTLTATPGDTTVGLSWTVPQTFLGIAISSYEVGVGTVSGSYVFTDVGNVTSHTQTGLTNGTPYFFIIKAKGPGGIFLVYSNEATATPVGGSAGGGGGGGGYSSTANIIFNGTAYPSSTVSLLRFGQVVQTVTADSVGSFSMALNNIQSGTEAFILYAFDSENNKSANLNLVQNLPPSVTTTVSNIIIPPTIAASHTSIAQGQMLTLKGYTAPGVPVIVSFTGPNNFTQNIVSGSNGYYNLFLDTNLYSRGQYSVTTQSRVRNFNSPLSSALIFSIGDQSVVVTPGECKRSDLNCDNRVNLIDFSILLYFWDSSSFSRNPRVDIDKSGQVGLRDLSIMLYDWTG
ncbi:MAG TPA: fibronectin type III domain-containing protein [Verrucomicrobiae bacterium]|nr:fibronectin type III domain-containing protein [Verrucomicrobiae bacterium]